MWQNNKSIKKKIKIKKRKNKTKNEKILITNIAAI